ncbi:Hsp20 family protein [Bacillus sp. AK128]
MNEELNDELLLEVDGVEEWMAQFVIDPFSDGNNDGIRMDLFETESTYIIEAIIKEFNKEEISLRVVKDGLHLILKKNSKKISRFVTLPFSLCKRKIQASLNNECLEITIQKKGKRRKKPLRTIKIQ